MLILSDLATFQRRLTLDYVISALGVDGESIYGRTRYPIYLFLASTLLDLCQRHMPDLEVKHQHLSFI